MGPAGLADQHVARHAGLESSRHGDRGSSPGHAVERVVDHRVHRQDHARLGSAGGLHKGRSRRRHLSGRALGIGAQVVGPGPRIVEQLVAGLCRRAHRNHALAGVGRQRVVQHALDLGQRHAAILTAGVDGVHHGLGSSNLLQAEHVGGAASGDTAEHALTQHAAAEAEADLQHLGGGVLLEHLVEGAEAVVAHAAPDTEVGIAPPVAGTVRLRLVDERCVVGVVAVQVDPQVAAGPPAACGRVGELEGTHLPEREVHRQVASHLVGGGGTLSVDVQACRGELVVARGTSLSKRPASLVGGRDAHRGGVGAQLHRGGRCQVEYIHITVHLNGLNSPVAKHAAAQGEPGGKHACIGVHCDNLGQGGIGVVTHTGTGAEIVVGPPVVSLIEIRLVDQNTIGDRIPIGVHHKLPRGGNSAGGAGLGQQILRNAGERHIQRHIASHLIGAGIAFGVHTQAGLRKLIVPGCPGLRKVIALQVAGRDIDAAQARTALSSGNLRHKSKRKDDCRHNDKYQQSSRNVFKHETFLCI